MALTKLTDIRKSLSVEVEDLQVNGITTFTGSVSIGGTLTYQDVTNIDSVGLITARAGVNVSGGQLDVGSNIKIGNAGVITATSLDVSGDIDVDGHTNLDNVSVAGVTTFTGAIDANNAIVISDDNALHFYGTSANDLDAILRESSGNALLINCRNDAILNIDSNNDSTSAHFAIAHGAATSSSTELLRVQEDGKVLINSTTSSGVGRQLQILSLIHISEPTRPY